VKKQRSILASAARLVKPGGRLVYATCRILEEETAASSRIFARQCPIHAAAAGDALEKADRLHLEDYLSFGRTGMAPTLFLPRSSSVPNELGLSRTIIFCISCVKISRIEAKFPRISRLAKT